MDEWTYIKRERTNNVLLRWLGNLADTPASYFLHKSMDQYDKGNLGLRWHWYSHVSGFLYNTLVFPYATYYEVILDEE